MNSLPFASTLAEQLETARLRLEPLTPGHANEMFAPMQNEAIYRWISLKRPESVESLRARYAKPFRHLGLGEGHDVHHRARVSPDGAEAWPAWVVRRKAEGACIGSVDVCISESLVATNFGYFFFADFWGQGFATEAVCAAVAFLEQRGVMRLVATITVGNDASVRVLRKAGFVFSRRLLGTEILAGVAHDEEEYVREGTS